MLQFGHYPAKGLTVVARSEELLRVFVLRLWGSKENVPGLATIGHCVFGVAG